MFNVFNSPTTASDVDAIVCTSTTWKDAAINAMAGYVLSGSTSMDSIVGVATSGVVIMTPLTHSSSVDPLYPAIYGTVTNIE